MSGRDVAHAWPWERLERSNSPSHDLLVEALGPADGERWIDLGRGSVGVALRATRRGAEGLDVVFQVADAGALPLPDRSFDVVASAVGVMFGGHARTAAELVRVCRPDGRLGLGRSFVLVLGRRR